MMVLRKLAVALLSVGVLLPGLSYALTVVPGIETKSALGEPFRGEVELQDLGGLSAEEIKVGLASQEDFERLGVDRAYALTDLKFDVVINPSGRSYINVTSSKPVREPFLNFVMSINFPGNARLVEETALLDPPMLGDTTAAPVEPAVIAGTATPIVTPVAPANVVKSVVPEAASSAPVASSKPSRPSRPAAKPAAEAAQDGTYRTKPSDTLWGVALKLRPTNGVSVHQTMIAIQRQNPEAFREDNINALKRGQVLHVPSEAQIREVSAQEAVASVREQNNAWRGLSAQPTAKPAKQQLDATAQAEQAPKAPATEPKAEMKLLAPEGGKKAVASAGNVEKSSVAPEVAKKLSQNQVKAEAAKKENKQLSSKVGTLDQKVKANDKALEVKNAKLAELQGQLKEQAAKADALKAEAAKKAEAKKAEEKAAADKAAADKLAAEKAAADKVTADKLAADKAAADKAAADKAAVPAADAAAAPAPAPLEAQQPAQIESKPLPESKPKPAVVEEPQEESSPLADAAPMLGLGAGLLALLGGAWFWKRKRDQEKADEEAALAELEAAEAGHDEAPDFGGDLPLALGGGTHESPALDLNDDFDSSFTVSGGDTQSAPLFKDSVLADPLEEVEQYLAYERYPQAVGFLNKAISASPDRTDLRLKLMEVYAKLDDHRGFAEQETALENVGDLGLLSRVEDLKATMSPPPRVKNSDDPIEFERAAPAQAQNLLADDDLPSLEELEMDFNASVSASSPNLKKLDDDFAAPAADAALSLDDDLDFSFSKADAPAVADEFDFKPAADDLSFSLDEPAFDEPKFEAPAFDAPKSTASSFGDLSLDDSLLDAPAAEPKSRDIELSGMSLGEIELADFDTTPEVAAKSESVELASDDLSFSLDDLEVSAPAAKTDIDLDGDFSLEDTVRTNTTELKLDQDAFQAESGLNDMAAEFDVALAKAPAAVASEPSFELNAPAPAAGDDDLGLGMDDEFDFLADTDENATKLDLAKAYIDMGDMEGARDILQEVLAEGNGNQKEEAKGLLAQVG